MADGAGPADDSLKEEADARYEAALAERGLADLRPPCRALLKRVRESDPEFYDEAVDRYERELVPRAAGGDDPVGEWFRYGRWLAARLAPGEATAVDASGRATPLEGDDPPPDALVLHLPENQRERAIVLSAPDELSEHQEETRELLCG